MKVPPQVLTTGNAPWIDARHKMELVFTSEHPPHPHLVTAAFVLVFDARQWLLLTKVDLPGRSWDVPGGHIDPGERADMAAVRELAEETGFEIDPSRISVAGWQLFTLLERPAAAYPYPYPLSYVLHFTHRHEGLGPAVRPAAGTECVAAQWCDPALVKSRCAGLSWFPLVAPVQTALFADSRA